MKKYVTSTYEITDAYQSIQIHALDASVSIAPSGDESTTLVCFENKKRPYTFFVQDETLTIAPQKRKWFHWLKIGVDHSKITLSVPSSAFEALTIQANVGAVSISSIACAGDINVQINTGKVDINDTSCKAFCSKGNTGSIALRKLTVAERISLKRNTGKIELHDCHAPEFFIKANTGSVCGTLPAGTLFVAKTNVGKIEVPQTAIGEIVTAKCEIQTNTGSIKFK